MQMVGRECRDSWRRDAHEGHRGRLREGKGYPGKHPEGDIYEMEQDGGRHTAQRLRAGKTRGDRDSHQTEM